MIGVGGFGTIVVIIILIILLTINHSGSQSSIPTTVIPKTYPYSQNCMVIVVQEQPKVELHECITSITVQPDGKLMVNMEWKTVSQSSSYGVSVQADKNNDHMYLTDDLGNRLDHVATGGGTNQSAKLYDGQSKQGWFLFPKPDQSATVFYFVDEDNGVTSPALDRLWP